MSVTHGPGKIHVLPDEVIGHIAAGEVVERPAAVVRELLDNSLDAGSTRITIEVLDGGRKLIRVTDDGEGMSRIDAPLAFQRHATSKLRTEQDLWSIQTLGFRGEALPSIAAVSKVRMVTACRNEPVGVQLLVAGGAVSGIEEAAAAPGTHVEVADLFFNTPARKKFLKAPATEYSHICQVVQQAALAWPDVQFRLRHNGQEVLEYAAASSRRDRLLQVYGKHILDRMLDVHVEQAGLRLEGVSVDAALTRTGRVPQDLFVNRRAIKNATVAHAVYDGYGSFLAKGRHPVYVLFLEVGPQRVDVNVHPAKREVRFADQDSIHQTVRQAIRDAVGGGQPAGHLAVLMPGQPARPINSQRPTGNGEQMPSAPELDPGRRVDRQESLVAGEEQSLQAPFSGVTAQEGEQPYLVGPSGEVIPLGQVDRTFLVAQVGTELQVIDQHTAHERVLFERLWRAWLNRSAESQPLLIPEPIDLPPQGAAVLQRSLADLEKLGLTIEPFGGSSFVIRAVPALLGHLDSLSLIQDLVDDLSEWDSTSSLEARMRPVLASLACHGAVRAGRAMEVPEMKRLIEDWVGEGLPMTCPHGRRVALRLSQEELARIFGRM